MILMLLNLFIFTPFTRARNVEMYTLNKCLVKCKPRIFWRNNDTRVVMVEEEEKEEEEDEGENPCLMENSPISVATSVCVCVCACVFLNTQV